MLPEYRENFIYYNFIYIFDFCVTTNINLILEKMCEIFLLVVLIPFILF